MKIDNNTLLLIGGGGLLAYYLYKNNRGMIAGGNGTTNTRDEMRRNPQSQSDCPQGTEFRLGEPWNICFNPLTAITPQSKSCPQGQTYTKRIDWNGGSFKGCATPEQIKNYQIFSLIS